MWSSYQCSQVQFETAATLLYNARVEAIGPKIEYDTRGKIWELQLWEDFFNLPCVTT
jgi:hypothetical protein